MLPQKSTFVAKWRASARSMIVFYLRFRDQLGFCHSLVLPYAFKLFAVFAVQELIREYLATGNKMGCICEATDSYWWSVQWSRQAKHRYGEVADHTPSLHHCVTIGSCLPCYTLVSRLGLLPRSSAQSFSTHLHVTLLNISLSWPPETSARVAQL